MLNDALVTLSGPTYATGVQTLGKRIDLFTNLTSTFDHDNNPATTQR